MKKVIIIENDLALLSKYVDILINSDYEVIKASDSKVGIDLALSEIPDLILCNTEVHSIDGFEVLSRLALNPRTIHIPFVFINPASHPELVNKALECGADDFITHPFNCNQLVRCVETHIKGGKRLRGSIFSVREINHTTLNNSKGLEKLSDLISQSKIRHLKRKQTLYYENDYSQWIYLLVKGSIKTLKLTNDGRQLITGLYKPNSLIGLDSLLLDTPWLESAEATEHSSLYFIPKNAVIDLLNVHVELNQHFIKILSKSLHEKEDQLVEIAYQSVRKRLAQVLIRLCKDTVPIDQLVISRDELAGLAGIAVETVSRILTDFKDCGLIDRNGSQIQIINLDGLIAMKS